jgi:hypothetical protein
MESPVVREPDAVSRKSVLLRRASSLVGPTLPLRAYFLSVGGALLLLLFAADWVLPAPLPGRLTDAHAALPPIRIHSELKGPDAIVIDTSRFEPVPMLPDNGWAAGPPEPQGSEIRDTVDISERSPAPATNTHLRDSLAQLRPAVSRSTRPKHHTTREHATASQARLVWTSRRSAVHPDFKSRRSGGPSLSREPSPCRCGIASN